MLSEPQETNDGFASTTNSPKISPLSVTQESLLIPKEMTSTDKLNSYAQNTQALNLFQKLEADSILNGESSSKYWNEYVRVISQHKAIAYADRAVRFGFPLIEWLCQQNGVKLMVQGQRNLSPEAELVEDILSILHCFSARLYGLRKYQKQVNKAIQEKTSQPDKEVDTQQCQETQGVSI